MLTGLNILLIERHCTYNTLANRCKKIGLMGYENNILAIYELNVFVKIGYDHCIVGTYSNL